MFRLRLRWWEYVLAVWDRVGPLVSVLFIISGFQAEFAYRYQPASPRAFHLNIVLPAVIAVLATLRGFVMKAETRQMQRRLTYNLGAGALALGALASQWWIPHPGPFYFLSGLLDRSPGQVVRLQVHSLSTKEGRTKTSEFSEYFATVSLPHATEEKIEINIARARIYAFGEKFVDLQAEWHPGLLGFPWLDRDTIKDSPDFYKADFEDSKLRRRVFSEFKGRRVIVVTIANCLPASFLDAVESLKKIERIKGVVLVAAPVDNGNCHPSGEEIARRHFDFVSSDAAHFFPSAFVNGIQSWSLEVQVFTPLGTLETRTQLISQEEIAKFERRMLHEP